MLEFLGRLHPLVLHLPIGILSFCFLLEVYYKYRKLEDSRAIQSFSLLAAAITSTIAVITGLLLIRDGDYTGSLVMNHRNSAIALAVTAWLLWIAHNRIVKKISKGLAYKVIWAVSLIFLVLTGHLGGSITHGEGFLFKQDKIMLTANIEDAYLYEDIISPILQNKCQSCHNPSKLKGELDMSDLQLLLKGGENGQAILVDAPYDSPVLVRINHPLEMEEHMPPKGKKQISKEELSLLEWWIKGGAEANTKATEYADFEEYKTVAGKFLAPPIASIFDKVQTVSDEQLDKLRKPEMKIYPRSQEDSGVYVSFRNRKDLKASDLKQLKKIRKNVAHLNLSGSGVNGSMMSTVSSFKHLQKLELANTGLNSQDLRPLKKLDYLQSLNLYNTDVDEEIIPILKDLPQLRQVYLWETKFDSTAIAALQKERPRLNIIYDINKDIFTDASLKPPVIQAKSDLFNDTLEVSLELNFKNINIFYSLDGTEPDSNSHKYQEPFKITESTQVKAIAMKASWTSSNVSEKQFVKAGHKIQEIKLHNQPNERYVEFGKKSFNNLNLGSTLFSDGEWVGYDGKHARLTAMLQDAKEISSVTIGALESSGSYIFYPQKIEILSSTDGKTFIPVAEEIYKIASESNVNSRKNITLEFDKHKARWIKVNVLSHLKNPPWHPAPGAKCWIFIDEILIN